MQMRMLQEICHAKAHCVEITYEYHSLQKIELQCHFPSQRTVMVTGFLNKFLNDKEFYQGQQVNFFYFCRYQIFIVAHKFFQTFVTFNYRIYIKLMLNSSLSKPQFAHNSVEL